jgi:hypothetical protein
MGCLSQSKTSDGRYQGKGVSICHGVHGGAHGGVCDSLKEVAGHIQDLWKYNERAAASVPKVVEKTKRGLPFVEGKILLVNNQSTARCLQEGRMDGGEWYAMAKGKDGAS